MALRTPDEDFGILLDAILLLEERVAKEKAGQKKEGKEASSSFPRLVLAITGKGPQKAMYMQKIGELEQQGKLVLSRICTLWLEPEDYPRLLGTHE